LGAQSIVSERGQAGPSAGDRVAAAFLLALLAVGSLMLWIGVPAGWLWLVSHLTDSAPTHYVVGIVGMPIPLILLGLVLAWINRLYMRIVWPDPIDPDDLDEDDEEELRVPRGPLEPLLVGSLLIAIVTMVLWFFLLAENPTVSIY